MLITKKEIQQQLSAGSSSNAIELFLCLAEAHDEYLYDGILMLAGQNNQLRRNIAKGNLDERTVQTRQAQIKNSIVGYLREVDKSWKVEVEEDELDLENIEVEPPEEKDASAKKRTILFLAANPRDTQSLDLDKEMRQITLGLERSKQRDSFQLVQKWAVQIDDLRRAFLDENPNIVHFSGHGSEAGRIILQSPMDTSQELPIQALGGFFKLFKDSVECVLLNACYSEAQAKLIAQHIPYVIGMSDAVYDAAALAFSTAFYDAIGNGREIPFAFEMAVNTIEMYGIPSSDVPVLIQGPKS